MAVELAAKVLAGALCFASPPAVDDAGANGPARSLESALRREASVLEGERAALRKAIDEVDRSAKASRQSLESELESLTRTLAQTEADNVALERSVPARERPRSLHDQTRQLEGLINDMRSWLETRRVQTPEHSTDDSGRPDRLVPLVERVMAEIEARGRLRVDAGTSYFAEGGEPRQAPVLRVGRVAAVAWGDEAVPLIDTPAGLIAARGVAPHRHDAASGVRVGAVLYESDAVPDPREFAVPDWRARMQQGGALMWVLLGFALVGGVVAIERVISLLLMTLRWRAANQRPEAHVGADAPSWLRPAARALGALRRGEAASEERLVQALLPLRQRAFRRISILGVVAAAAPLTGLLGTVTGMIATFTVVTERGTSDPQALAGGISEALLTTQFGLAIAIPVLLVQVGVQRGARRLVGRAEAALLGAWSPSDEHPPDAAAASDGVDVADLEGAEPAEEVAGD